MFEGYGDHLDGKDHNDCDIVQIDSNYFCNNEFGTKLSKETGGDKTK